MATGKSFETPLLNKVNYPFLRARNCTEER